MQKADIGHDDYCRLLNRLYGFYLPYERAAQTPPERSGWLRRDLAVLADPRHVGATTPLCDHMPVLDSVERRLGAMYVVEGSTLGGRALAVQLDHVCGVGVADGRRFFQGRGGDTGEAWRGILDRLRDHDDDEAAHPVIIAAALETFACFERWMTGWRASAHD